MQLSNFNDYLGLFAALNLGYAGFKRFRSAIDKDILKIANESPKIQKLPEGVQAIDRFEPLNQNIQIVKTEVLKRHQEVAEKIKERSKTALKIAGGFKSMFLFTFMYCLIIMVVGGYQEYFTDKAINGFLFLLNFSALYNILMLIRSFVNKFKSKKISPLIPISLLILYIVAIILLTHNSGYEFYQILPLEKNIALTLIIAASPFIFHFLRLYIHRIIFKMKHKKNDKNYARLYRELEHMVIEKST
jgi:hypothetical protein